VLPQKDRISDPHKNGAEAKEIGLEQAVGIV
jgi:hypothetical protein